MSLDQLTNAILNASGTLAFQQLEESSSHDLSIGTEFSENSKKLAKKIAGKMLEDLKYSGFNNVEFSQE